MTEVLSQEEIDQLLTAINAGSDTDFDEFKPTSDRRKIRIYDFKRPDKFSKEQIRTICILHEIFVRQAALQLTRLFKMLCHVHVASVDQLTYEEFIRSIPTPTTIAVLNPDKLLKGKIVIEIDPTVSLTLINRAFGGQGTYNNHHHELTRLELVVMQRALKTLSECLSEGWKPIVPDLRVDISRIESNPQFINASPPEEMIILVTMEAKVGDVEGMINIGYPCTCLTGVMERLSAQFLYDGKDVPHRNYALANRYNVPVGMVAEILRRDYPIRKILDWRVEGLILPLAELAPNTCYLRFDNSRIFQCELLPDNKWFPKTIKIIDFVKNPKTKGGMEMNVINPEIAEVLADASITISVELGRTTKTINEILKMGEGTIVELDKLAGEPVDIKANGVLIAQGEVVVIDENFGVRITEIVRALELNPTSKQED